MKEEPRKILVVDDNADNRELLSRRLEKRGYVTVCADSGPQALDFLQREEFDLILLDIMMPEISGIEVLEKVRQEKSMADLPVIMATAKDASEDMVHALKLGANDYITKPIDFPVLFARVQTQLALKMANDRNHELVGQLNARNDFIRSIFGRYVSDSVVDQLLGTPDALRLGGETKQLSVMFADLRGFTPIAESLPPANVVDMLNTHFGVMTDVIEEFNGTINEFYGDGILAFFGAPIPQENHARAALQCAVRMQQLMERVNRLNTDAGLPALAMGIGINTGNVVIGNIGAHTRSKYGIVGSPVNLAARIQSSALPGEVLVSETSLGSAGKGFELGEERTIQAKGIDHPVRVYPITGVSGPDSVAEKTSA